MDFGIIRKDSAPNTFHSIDEKEFLTIKDAKEGLVQSLYVEEKFDLIIENLLELEGALLDATARHTYFSHQDWCSFQSFRVLFNRRLMNLLSSCRSYTDHVRHYIKNIFSGDSGALSDVNCLFSREYDSRLGYRVAEALRNYVQHRGFQVHSITFNSRWIESEERIKDKLCCSVTPYLQTLELREDSIFKKTILDELEKNLGDKVDVKVIVRDYVEGLYTVHHEIRNKLEPKINYWENSLTSVIDRFREQSSEKENDVWLAAIKRDDDGRWVEQIQIFLDFMNYRKALVQKNSRLGTITRRYVSSEVISD